MTDIIYIVKDSDKSEEVDIFEFLIKNKAMLNEHNADKNLKIFRVDNRGNVIPHNKKIQSFVDDTGYEHLPIALTLKQNALYTSSELSSMFEGLDIQSSNDENFSENKES
ncbi:hypothetical protein [Liquorilactobacillus uvarum]|uniref:Arsenical resistance operon trans-acting repressor ArsD n=1 Tax=Liquorilactobacillus uvarum DSM 19971 TaxID=1423812 RepID=A0A0R1Q2F8_9LACO|nr:hypothetical protein [Liquorilactobacillus uvarum]KRL35331.1 hypothetical protein FD20_GL001490 [Liquorilactobacillus uvarum DSM 19971]